MTEVLSLPKSGAPWAVPWAVPYDLPPSLARAEAKSPDRLSAFCFAWSAYLFLHHSMVYWAWFRLTDSFGNSNLTTLAIGLILWLVGATALLRPRSLRWFTALLVCHLVYEIPALPKTANHTFLTICMNVTMLAVITAHAIRSRGRAFVDDGEGFFPRMAALLRLEVLAMYFFVVLHKLNADYFNPTYSCATQLYAEIVRDYPYFPSGSWTDPLCVWGAIGCEAAIPLLLLFPRTRLVGVGLGLLFHLLLSPHENPFIYSYSALLYAAYFLFLPNDVLAEMTRAWATLLSRLRRRWIWFVLAGSCAATIVVLLRVLAPQLVRETKLIDHGHVLLSAGVRFAWNLLALFNIYAFARAVSACRGPKERSAEAATPEPFFRPALTPLLVFPLLVALNGFCPYLGLKTESAFAMYANLRTEGTANNHLFMPRLDLANYQNDLVEIVDSSDRQLRGLKREGYGWTYLEFRRKLARQRSERFWVTFKRNGVETTLRRSEHRNDPAFAPLPWYERRLLYFRDVQLGASPQHCGH